MSKEGLTLAPLPLQSACLKLLASLRLSGFNFGNVGKLQLVLRCLYRLFESLEITNFRVKRESGPSRWLLCLWDYVLAVFSSTLRK
jgi:hypothetical protein